MMLQRASVQRTPHRVGYSRRTGALLTLLPTSLFPPHLIYALLTLLCVCVCVCVKFCHRGGAGIHTQRCQAVWPAHHQFLHIFYVFIFILCYFFFSVLLLLLRVFFCYFLFPGMCPHRRPPTGGGSIYFLSLSPILYVSLFFFKFFFSSLYSFSYARMENIKKTTTQNKNECTEEEEEMEKSRRRRRGHSILISLSLRWFFYHPPRFLFFYTISYLSCPLKKLLYSGMILCNGGGQQQQQQQLATIIKLGIKG